MKAIVVYYDILGFSQLMIENPNKHIEKIKKLWEWLNKESKEKNIKIFLFSDCGFLLKELSNNNRKDNISIVSDMINFVRLLYKKYIEEKYLLRGAITIGDVKYTDNLILGECVKKAVDLEAKYCPGPFFIFPKKYMDKVLPENYLFSFLPIESLELKIPNNMSYCGVILPTDIDKLKKKIKSLTDYYLTNGPSNYAYFWYKVNEYIKDKKI